ncbi:SCA7-domain-containing protein [Cylindrobasidium torrendii FP15055 ss-10]|uniref:SCA7-domain-containing protein n=1 Tax=Cylindrobasidium torrendii FP15055 ss-10 TaxID=1314674 RepID=A0A0D7BJ92_9AGAR|nr:SCA7-domain-containing protein [Cylindrobasidium torrendii FP15055 ss-10]
MVKKVTTKASPSPAPFDFDAPWYPEPPAENVPAAPTAWLDATSIKTFGCEPITATVGIMRCHDCSKSVLRSYFMTHKAECAEIRKQRDKASKTAKKRKLSPEAGGDDEGQPSKKKSKAAAPQKKDTTSHPDRNCYVWDESKGRPCQRSLTCKTHSMGAKRSVPGRSRPFNDLLHDHQRATNPNFVEPVKKPSKAERKEAKDREKAEKKRIADEAAIASGIKKPGEKDGKSKKSKKAAAAAAAGVNKIDVGEPELEENLDDLDSEAEVEVLTNSIRAARQNGIIARPLAVPISAHTWFVARNERARSVYDLLGGALNGGKSILAS